ncbi:hypothetical protein HUJ04_003221 [Dendroctonus ponderosae]|nr:hypothetical protein HUJ04_003221 [Dendroctonus ponderosae]
MNRMRKFWKLAQLILRNRGSNTGFVRRFSSLASKISPNWNSGKFKYLHICLIGSIIPQGKINLEDDLRQAIEDGEQAIVQLMNELQDLVTSVSKEYRSSLSQQIELIQITGDEASHELLQFRAVADELNNELNEYAILLKAIGDIAYDQTMISLMVDANALAVILKKYKELEIVLLREFEANKQMELQLLQILSAMSCQKGNTVRSRPQKYKNKTAFKNNLHDTSQRTKTINSISVGNVCQRCKDIIEWKIKYKKYKPLSQLKTCVKCGQKAISKAYHTICDTCRKNLGKYSD